MRVEMAAMKRDADHYSRQVISVIYEGFLKYFPNLNIFAILIGHST